MHAALEEAEAEHLDVRYNWLTGTFPEGGFRVATPPRVLIPASANFREPDRAIPIESTAGIQTWKLRLRMFSYDEFVTRDFQHVYDICTAAEMDPGALTGSRRLAGRGQRGHRRSKGSTGWNGSRNMPSTQTIPKLFKGSRG